MNCWLNSKQLIKVLRMLVPNYHQINCLTIYLLLNILSTYSKL